MYPRAPLCCAVTLAAAALALGCSDSPITAPEQVPSPVPPQAFHVTVHRASGTGVVRPPAVQTSKNGPSFSLIGADAVELLVSNVQWAPGGESVTMDLSLHNTLPEVDLVLPTEFPRPPAGATGVLVFPFASAALGNPGAPAPPTTDWDGAPHNFFNDGACTSSGGGKGQGKPKSGALPNDCYRYEEFAGPLYGGEISAARTVGFSVPADATGIEFDAVVAADLRSNPLLTSTLLADPALDGFLQIGSASPEVVQVIGGTTFLSVGGGTIGPFGQVTQRGFVGFRLDVLGPIKVESARLTMSQLPSGTDPYTTFGSTVLLDHVLLSDPIAPSLYHQAAMAGGFAQLTSSVTEFFPEVDVSAQVAADAAADRPLTGFRLRFDPVETGPIPISTADFTTAEASGGASVLEVVHRVK